MAAKTKAEKRAAQVKKAKAHLAASAAAYKRSIAEVAAKGVSKAGIKELQRNEGRHAKPKIVERREGRKTYYTIGSGHLLDNSAEAIAAFKKAWGPPRDDGKDKGKGWKTKRNELLKGEGTIPDDVIDALFAYDANRKVDATRKMFSKNNNEKTTMFHTLEQDTRDALFSGMFRGEFKRSHGTVKAIIAGDMPTAALKYMAGGKGKTYKLQGGGSIKAPDGIREDLGRAILSKQGYRILTAEGKLYPSTTGVVKRMMVTQKLLDRDALPAQSKLLNKKLGLNWQPDDLSEDPDKDSLDPSATAIKAAAKAAAKAAGVPVVEPAAGVPPAKAATESMTDAQVKAMTDAQIDQFIREQAAKKRLNEKPVQTTPELGGSSWNLFDLLDRYMRPGKSEDQAAAVGQDTEGVQLAHAILDADSSSFNPYDYDGTSNA